MNKKRLAYSIAATALFLLIIPVLGCGTTESAVQSGSNSTTRNQQQAETQWEKYQRLISEDGKNLVVVDGMSTIESIEAELQPQLITRIGEIPDAVLSEPGRPYYFKLRAIYKGHDAKAERVLLQDLGQKSTVGDAAFGAAYGIDTNVYPIDRYNVIVPTLPTEANSIATFYIVAIRWTDRPDKNWRGNIIEMLIRFVRNVEKPAHDPSKFIVASGMRYITVNDARVTTQEDVMAHYFTGGATGASGNVFDPIIYPLTDLMDARAEMNKKNILNDYTLPTVQIKFVSEVIFRGQSNTTITLSTADNVLTERMNFTGRASSVGNGEKIRVYYTIAKERVSRISNEAVEKWEIQAIERL